jgi:hypothetical protein
MAEQTSYEQEMATARQCLQARQWPQAYRHFGKAHSLGHDVLKQHLAAHRGMIHAGWRGGRLDQAALNVLLLLAAYLFDKDAEPGTGTAPAR